MGCVHTKFHQWQNLPCQETAYFSNTTCLLVIAEREDHVASTNREKKFARTLQGQHFRVSDMQLGSRSSTDLESIAVLLPSQSRAEAVAIFPAIFLLRHQLNQAPHRWGHAGKGVPVHA